MQTTRLRWTLYTCICVGLFLNSDRSQAIAQTGRDTSAWTLRVADGDTYRGSFAKSSTADRLGWQSPSFLAPLEFPWQSIDKIERNRNTERAYYSDSRLPENTFCIELHSGLALSGQLLSANENQMRIAVENLGELSIPLTDIANVLRIGAVSGSFVEVLQANSWEQVLPAPKNGKATKWFLKAGEISTDTSGTTISQWANLSELATIDIDVAWEQASVNWWLTIGEPRRMELQVRKLQNKNLLNITLGVENSKDADITTVQIPYEKERSIALRLLCDANKATYVLMQDQKVLGRIKGNVAERIVGRTKVSFTNTAVGVLTLRDLRITSRPFALPSEASEPSATLTEFKTSARGTFFGTLETTDSNASFQVRGANDALTSVAFDELERIEFPKRPVEERSAVLGVELSNGLRFASDKIAFEDLASSPDPKNAYGIRLVFGEKSILIPEQSIERILSHRIATPSDASLPAEATTWLRLITDDVVSIGKVDAVHTADDKTTTLAWRPRHASNASPINPMTDGAIEPSINIATKAPKKSRGETPMAVIRNDIAPPEVELSRSLKPNDPSLFLVSGDCFPGTVLSGDQESIQFQSPLFQQTTIPSHLVRGIRFVEFNGGESMDRITRNRLLTLPRMQRKNPPTHVVVARDGDVVRGRLISFDRDQLLLEVRGEEQRILVKNIAEVIALEAAPSLKAETETKADLSDVADEMDGSQPSPTSEPQGTLYQVILEQGARVSLAPVKVDTETLSGTHPILGPCSLPWSSISRLILGNAIRVDAARNRFGKWKLQNAPDPKFVNEEGQPANDAPTDTMHDRLIGQAAPDFDLAKLDGTPCQLEDYRGKILILDFWASWCGPCIRSMPRVLEISRTYQELGAELVLVNLEEKEDRVRAFLEKLEILPTVVLDSDGAMSKQYGVQAIPQTVIVDRDGTIAKILVGAGEENEAELLSILDELTAREPR